MREKNFFLILQEIKIIIKNCYQFFEVKFWLKKKTGRIRRKKIKKSKKKQELEMIKNKKEHEQYKGIYFFVKILNLEN